MYIIQTNRTKVDFQTYMYEVNDRNWNCFKDSIINNREGILNIRNTYDNLLIHEINKIRKGFKIKEVLINDEKHFSIKFDDGTISEYSLVNRIK